MKPVDSLAKAKKTTKITKKSANKKEETVFSILPKEPKKENAKPILILKRVLLFLFFVALFSGFFTLLTLNEYYADKFLPNTKLAGIDLSGKNLQEASEVIFTKTNEFAKKENTVKISDKEFKYTLGQLGVNYKIEDSLFNAYQEQHDTDPFQNLKKQVLFIYKNFKESKDFSLAQSFDKPSLESFVTELKKQVDVLPVNSTIVYQSGVFVVSEDKSGTVINAQELEKELTQNASTLNETEIKIEPKKEPAQIKTSVATNSIVEAEKLLNKKFTFIYNGKNFSPSKDVVATWIEVGVVENKIKPTLNQEKLYNYLATLKGVVRKTVDQQVSILNGQETIIRTGQAGVAVDMKQTMPKVLAQLDNQEISVELVTTQTEPKKVVIDTDEIIAATSERYIDVDISSQWMTLFEEGGVVVARYRVSTGKWNMPTPLGWGSVLNKSPRAYSSKYGLYMPYWMAFKGGGYGIHELPEWPNGAKEGQSHLGTRVSHGCVRLGVGPAEAVYNWSPIGTKVFVHN